MAGRVLVIAGSDSGGGAGIQADIKTIMALGGYATTAITALTAQNTLGVQGIYPIEAGFVLQQIDSVLSDIGADAIKLGMLANAKIALAVADRLQRESMPIVFDPVMISTSGKKLLGQESVSILLKRLLPLSALITPNIPEAEALTGMTIFTPEDKRRSAEKLLKLGAKAVLIKGGHGKDEAVTDLYMSPGALHEFSAPRINTRHTHGTGCTLASAIAVGLTQGMEIIPAIARAHAYVQNALKTATGLGNGNGPLNHRLVDN